MRGMGPPEPTDFTPFSSPEPRILWLRMTAALGNSAGVKLKFGYLGLTARALRANRKLENFLQLFVGRTSSQSGVTSSIPSFPKIFIAS